MSKLKGIAEKAKKLEQLIQQDPGNRGIKYLITKQVEGSLLRTCRQLFEAKSIGILTGFCIPPTETDGPLGAISIAKTLHHLGKKVTFVTDDTNSEVMKRVIKSSGLDVCPLYVFPTPETTGREFKSLEQESRELAKKILEERGIDHVLSIEKPGYAQDGNFYSMSGREITRWNSHAHLIFEGIPNSGIGDGGNELGMGNVQELVQKHIKNGEKIATVVKTDNLIIAGVSNWGGYAVSAVLYLLSGKNSEEMYKLITTPEEDAKLCNEIVSAGAVDGISGKHEPSIDGMPHEGIHKDILLEISKICSEE